MWHLISVCMLIYLLVWLCWFLKHFLLVYYFSPFILNIWPNIHRFVCFLTWLIDSNSTIDKVGGEDERTRSMSNVSATKSWGGWKSPPTPSVDNGNWNKNPQEFFGIFDTLIDRCTLVVWAVTNSRNRNNWRSTSVTHLPNVLTTIVHFAKQPPRDVYFLRQTHKSK